MSSEGTEERTDDAILGGRLRLWQLRCGHRFGHDAILLAAAAPVRPDQTAVELGAGVGACGLALAYRVPRTSVTLVEIDPELVALGHRNAERNGLGDRVRAVTLPVEASASEYSAAGLPQESADHVLMNPPFRAHGAVQASPDLRKARAHNASPQLLRDWVRAAHRLLKPGGTLTLIYDAGACGNVIAALAGSFRLIRLRPVHSRPEKPPIRVIATAERAGDALGASGGTTELPPFHLRDALNRPSAAAERVLRDGAALDEAAATCRLSGAGA